MAQNVKKVASKNLKKPKVAENSKSCQNSKKLPKISKVAEKLPSNLWLSLLRTGYPHSRPPDENYVYTFVSDCQVNKSLFLSWDFLSPHH